MKTNTKIQNANAQIDWSAPLSQPSRPNVGGLRLTILSALLASCVTVTSSASAQLEVGSENSALASANVHRAGAGTNNSCGLAGTNAEAMPLTISCPRHSPSQMFREEEILGAGSIGSPPSSIGLPSNRSEIDPTDLLTSSLSIQDVLRRGWESGSRMDMGNRLKNFETTFTDAIRRSTQNEHEKMAVLVLNRSLQLFLNSIQWTLQNPNDQAAIAAVAPMYLRFFERSHFQAIAYLNNARLQEEKPFSSSQMIAAVGVQFSRSIFQMVTDVTASTPTLQSLLLIRIVTYLSHDLNLDPARRDYAWPFSELHALRSDQNGPYVRILTAFQNRVSPVRADVTYVRAQVGRLLDDLDSIARVYPNPRSTP